MGRQSTIARLDPRIKEAVDTAIREGRATIDDIVDLVEHMGRELGTGDEVSRSAVGRYKKTAEQAMEVYRVSQSMAQVWAKRIGEDPESDIARLASQVLGGVALNTANSMLGEGEPMPAGEVMFLAKALDHLARADKVTTDKILKVRQEVAKQAAEKAAKIARKGGMSRETVEEIRREILGVAR